ncbi:MAG TPA: ABC transporter substrate-binding protein [Nocardioides sp.]|nr:ABC transporter substrate-binding protein [Nocardioides sp.]
MRTPRTAAVLVPLMLLALGCAPQDSSTATDTNASSDANQTPAECAQGKTLTSGVLTVATDSPAYDPWFTHNKPSNGKGYESAVAYAVAQQLGFDRSAVTWVKEPFNKSYAPGDKNFDFDINQISITPARAKVVTFSDGYYTAAQALIALKGSPAARATTLADLKGFKLGAQTGTTSLTAIREDIQPSSQPLVFDDTNVAKQALLNHQVDGIVADLPTAFYITAVQIPNSTIVGQFQQQSGSPEQFGMLFGKDNPLVGCVNQALANLKSEGTLDAIEKKWLSQTVNVPVLK